MAPKAANAAPEPTRAEATKPVQKTYYIDSMGLTINWQKSKKVLVDGQIHTLTPERDIRFDNGVYSTKDPDEQAFLDTYRGCVTFEQWEKTHISPEARREKATRENASMKTAMVEKDEELAKLRALLAAKEA